MNELSLKELNRPGLIEKFRQQLHRDYELSGCEAFVPQLLSAVYEELLAQITQSLHHISDKSTSAYTALIYRIDLSEKQIHDAALKSPDTGLFEVVAGLVIRRILQKVILKEYYSNHEHTDPQGND